MIFHRGSVLIAQFKNTSYSFTIHHDCCLFIYQFTYMPLCLNGEGMIISTKSVDNVLTIYGRIPHIESEPKTFFYTRIMVFFSVLIRLGQV